MKALSKPLIQLTETFRDEVREKILEAQTNQKAVPFYAPLGGTGDYIIKRLQSKPSWLLGSSSPIIIDAEHCGDSKKFLEEIQKTISQAIRVDWEYVRRSPSTADVAGLIQSSNLGLIIFIHAHHLTSKHLLVLAHLLEHLDQRHHPFAILFCSYIDYTTKTQKVPELQRRTLPFLRAPDLDAEGMKAELKNAGEPFSSFENYEDSPEAIAELLFKETKGNVDSFRWTLRNYHRKYQNQPPSLKRFETCFSEDVRTASHDDSKHKSHKKTAKNSD